MDSENKGVPLLELATAYQSLRDSGFDFPTAIGELIDNAIQANAQRIDIRLNIQELKNERTSKTSLAIVWVAVLDNGDGMDEATLNGCPQLGYSTRYNDRNGLGRFGVGATLAAISQCKRITICSKPKGTKNFVATYVDLDEIAGSNQSIIPTPTTSLLPISIGDFIRDDTNTVVIWDKCDRLQKDANGNLIDAQSLLLDLKNWVSRAYRYYIWDGVTIVINDERVTAHDPLYINTLQTGFPKDPPATIEFSHSFLWSIPNSPDENSTVTIKLTLLPPELRPKRGSGGSEEAQQRRIPENEGISVLRHKREVAFGNFYPMVPASTDIDRWWGCEIHFEPELDECWEVRNVKRGARPTKELRETLRQLLNSRIAKLRKAVQDYWKEVDEKEKQSKGIHSGAEQVVKEVESRAKPSTQAGSSLTESEKQQKKDEAIDDPDLSSQEKAALETKVSGPNPLPISIKSKAMTGAEFMETDHIGNGQIIITFNKNHPFFSEIYSKLEQLEQEGNDDVKDMALQIRYAIDLLIMAYGRAESMIDLDDEQIDSTITMLRSYWGIHLRQYINSLTKNR